MKRLALAMLIVGLLASYSWRWMPPGVMGEVWNISSHAHVAWLLLLVGFLARDPDVWAVVALVLIWQAIPAGCSVWVLLDPGAWALQEERCSRRLGLPLGLIGLVMAVRLAAGVGLEKMKNGP